MENLINEKNYEEPLYELIGNEQQTLQLILMPNQKIFTRKAHVLYMSDTVNMKEQYSSREKFKYH